MPRAAAAEPLDDLVHGRSPVTVAPCAGADHSMLSISGIVPNGVPAAFLTAPDGTAVRADVNDNGYEFLLPNRRMIQEQRYVVWTGGDGTPHVQPVVAFPTARPSACKAAAKLSAAVARVSPDGLFACMSPVVVGVPPALARRGSRARRLRLMSAPGYAVRCWAATPVAPKFLLPGGRVPVPPPVAAVPGRPLPVPAPSVAPTRPAPAPVVPPNVRKPR
jgi:hypothetical protein